MAAGHYVTRDRYEAAFLLASGAEYDGVEKKTNARGDLFFRFRDGPAQRERIRAYHAGAALSARDLFAALTRVRHIINDERR